MNITSILEEHNIQYSESGRNIAPGWIGINCPFCGDNRNHLGINTNTGGYFCFVCGQKGFFVYLLKKITGKYIQIGTVIGKEHEQIRAQSVEFNYSPILSSGAIRYLKSRRFDPEKLNVFDGGFVGDFKYRIIIPFYKRNKLVTYIGRDYTEKQNPKYNNLSKEKSIISTKELLYNEHTCADTVIVVEGVMDCWRIGNSCVSLSGKIATETQINLLQKYPRIFIMLDSNARTEAVHLCEQLESSMNEVHIVEYNADEPDDLSDDDVCALRKQIFGRIF